MEQRLRETFPVMVATPPSAAPAAASARLALPPSLAAVGNRDASAIMQGAALIRTFARLRSDIEDARNQISKKITSNVL